LGLEVSGLGDINGDGLDDFSISALGLNGRGAVYVYFGRTDGWAIDSSTSRSDLRLQGKNDDDNLGYAVDGGDDVNGDGIDDMILGAYKLDTNLIDEGKVYLVTGKATGWTRNITMDGNSTASFVGEASMDQFGFAVAMAGDVNGDRFGDFIVGANYHDHGSATESGKVYLFLGRASGWSDGASASFSAESWLGESVQDELGYSMDGGGDLNGDGYDDIIFGSPKVSPAIGKAYVVFPDNNTAPITCQAINVYEDSGFSQLTNHIKIFDTAYIQVMATDINISKVDTLVVNVSSSSFLGPAIQVALRETDLSSGLFRGAVTVTEHNNERKAWIGATPGDTITITPIRATAPSGSFLVDWSLPTILPLTDNNTVYEDSFYNQTYSVLGGKPNFLWNLSGPVWMNSTQNGRDFTIYGVPRNNDVGVSAVYLNVSDSLGAVVSRPFAITVVNTPPVIFTNGTLNVTEDQPFTITLNCSDSEQGTIIWSGVPSQTWIRLFGATGVLTGTAHESEVGDHYFTISVDDGNHGKDYEVIDLYVKNINEPPVITSTPVTTADELKKYNYNVFAKDTDSNTTLTYGFDVAPNGMSILGNGSVEWVPSASQGGNHSVVINVTDGENFVTQSYNITVLQYPPNATLLEPANGTVVDIAAPLLKWKVQYINDNSVNAKIYLSKNRAEIESPSNGSMLGQAFHATFYSLNTQLDPGQTYYWTVIPFDKYHTGTCLNGIFQFTVNASVGNRAPVINSQPNATAFTGYLYHYAVKATDPGDVLSYALIAPPSGMTIDSKTGDINWTPKPADVGDHTITVRVSDKFVHVEQTYTLKVLLTNSPTIESIPKQTVLVGKLFSYRAIGHDLDVSDNLTYSLSGQPVGMSIDAKSGLIEWKPGRNQAGTYTIKVQVSDGLYLTNTTFTLKVSKVAPVNFFTTPTFFIILLLLMVLVIAAIVAFVVVSRKRQKVRADALAQKEAQEKHAMATELQAVKTAAQEEKEMVEDFTVEGAFVIYQDGRLIARKATTEADIDEQLFSSMLIAIQGFVKESFRSESGLDSFEFGGRHVTLVKGQYVFLAVSLSGKEPQILRERMRELVEKIEGTYAGVVESWDGDSSRFRDLDLMLTPLFTLRDELKVKKAQDEVKVLSSLEFYEGFVRLKVAVMNKTPTTITDASLNLTYNRDALKFNKIEPEMQHEGTNVTLGAVKPGEKKTVAYYLDPLICQESVVDCTLTYYDFKGAINHMNMKRRPVDIVCPIFYTAQTVNVAMLKRLLGDLQYHDSKIYKISDVPNLKSMFNAAKDAVTAHSVKFVREFTEESTGDTEAWYFGEVQTSGEKMVIRVSSKVSMKFLEVFVASSNLATQTGLLAELGISINSRIKRLGIVDKDVLLETSPDIKAVMERTALLLDKYAEAEVPPGDNK
jgi:hypothetical protein